PPATIAVMDFTGVGCLDYSCADEIVAKLVRDKVKVLLLRGLTDAHREAIEPVLAGAGLAVLCERADGVLEGLGASEPAPALLDDLIASEWIYGGVHRLFREEFGKLGIDVSFVNPTQQRTWKKAMRKTTRAVFLETPTNPLLRVIDLEPVATVCKAEGLALIVDS